MANHQFLTRCVYGIKGKSSRIENNRAEVRDLQCVRETGLDPGLEIDAVDAEIGAIGNLLRGERRYSLEPALIAKRRPGKRRLMIAKVHEEKLAFCKSVFELIAKVSIVAGG